MVAVNNVGPLYLGLGRPASDDLPLDSYLFNVIQYNPIVRSQSMNSGHGALKSAWLDEKQEAEYHNSLLLGLCCKWARKDSRPNESGSLRHLFPGPLSTPGIYALIST